MNSMINHYHEAQISSSLSAALRWAAALRDVVSEVIFPTPEHTLTTRRLFARADEYERSQPGFADELRAAAVAFDESQKH